MHTHTRRRSTPRSPHPRRASVLSKLSLHDGSVLVVLGSPEQVWRDESDGHLLVHLLGGGFAELSTDQLYFCSLFRRPQPVSAVADPRS